MEQRWFLTSVNGRGHWFDEGKKRSLCGGHQWVHVRGPAKDNGRPFERCYQCARLLDERSTKAAPQPIA